MESKSLNKNPVLFPYSYVTGDERKRLCLLLPELLLLRLFEPEDGEKTSERPLIKYFCPVKDKEFLGKLRKAISEDRTLVYEHTDGENLAIWEEILADEAMESAPFHLVTRIRGRFKNPDEKESKLWQKGYILQLAIELEKQGIELVDTLTDVRRLESEFRVALGVEEDEKLGLSDEGYASATGLWEYRDSALSVRIKAWCFFCLMADVKKLLPVVISKSVRDELEIQLEILEREIGTEIKVHESVAKLPDPAVLSDSRVREIREETIGWMEGLFSDLENERLDRVEASFTRWIDEIRKKTERDDPEQNTAILHVSLMRVEGISLEELFKRFAGISDISGLSEGKFCYFFLVYPES